MDIPDGRKGAIRMGGFSPDEMISRRDISAPFIQTNEDMISRRSSPPNQHQHHPPSSRAFTPKTSTKRGRISVEVSVRWGKRTR